MTEISALARNRLCLAVVAIALLLLCRPLLADGLGGLSVAFAIYVGGVAISLTVGGLISFFVCRYWVRKTGRKNLWWLFPLVTIAPFIFLYLLFWLYQFVAFGYLSTRF